MHVRSGPLDLRILCCASRCLQQAGAVVMSTGHDIDSIQLTAWFCGEGSPEERERVSAHVQNCVACRRRVERLEADKAAFLQAMPFGESVARSVAGGAGWLRPLYAVAALLVVAVSVGVVYRQGSAPEGFRSKGGQPSVAMYVRSAQGEPEVRGSGVYFPGERVQLTYSVGEEQYFALLGIDEGGTISTYFPAEGDSAMLLVPGRDVPLPRSIELDEYLGRECYLAVFAAEPFTVESMRMSLREQFETAGGLEELAFGLPGAQVHAIRIVKRGRER